MSASLIERHATAVRVVDGLRAADCAALQRRVIGLLGSLSHERELGEAHGGDDFYRGRASAIRHALSLLSGVELDDPDEDPFAVFEHPGYALGAEAEQRELEGRAS